MTWVAIIPQIIRNYLLRESRIWPYCHIFWIQVGSLLSKQWWLLEKICRKVLQLQETQDSFGVHKFFNNLTDQAWRIRLEILKLSLAAVTPSDLMPSMAQKHLTLILPPIEINNLKSRLLDKELKDIVKDHSLRKLTLIGATLHLGFQIKSIWKWLYNTQWRKVTRKWIYSSMKTL